MTRKLNSTFSAVAVSLLCISGLAFLQTSRIKTITEQTFDKEFYGNQAQISQVNVELYKKLPAFGFDNLVADGIMLRFIQYFGDDEARKVTGYSLSADYLEAIINHDPNFISAYTIISPASSLFAGTPERTVALMSEGVQSLSPENPEAYWVWIYKAVDELLFLGDAQAAQKSYQMAAEWAAISDDPDSNRIEKSARRTAQFLSRNPNSTTAQIGAWMLVLTSASDQETRQFAIQNIQQLGGTVEIQNGNVRVQAPPEE